MSAACLTLGGLGLTGCGGSADDRRAALGTESDDYELVDFPDCKTHEFGNGGWDDAGNVYVPCGDLKTIKVYDAEGRPVPEATTSLPFPVYDVAPAADGAYLYVATSQDPPRRLNRQANGSYALDPNWALSKFEPYGGDPTEPRGLYLDTDAQGNVYVSDGTLARPDAGAYNMLLKYSPTGRFITKFGDYANTGEDGKFYALRGIAVTRDGSSIFVVDGERANRIQRWDRRVDAAGKESYVLSSWQIGTDELEANNDQQVGPKPGCVFTTGAEDWNDGKLSAPYGVALDESKNVYVLNTSCNEVLKFAPDETYLAGVDVGPNYVPNVHYVPHGFAVSKDGNRIYVPNSADLICRGDDACGGGDDDDREPPTTSAPTEAVQGPLGDYSTTEGNIPVEFTWSGEDNVGITQYDLRIRSNWVEGEGFFEDQKLSSPTATSSKTSLVPGGEYQAAIRARDAAGNVSNWKYGPRFTVNVFQESASAISPRVGEGNWSRVKDSRYYGGKQRQSKVKGSKATFAFNGFNVVLVGSPASTGGRAKVAIDGQVADSLSWARSAGFREVIFQERFDSTAQHTLTLKSLDISKYVNVDAFIVFEGAN